MWGTTANLRLSELCCVGDYVGDGELLGSYVQAVDDMRVPVSLRYSRAIAHWEDVHRMWGCPYLEEEVVDWPGCMVVEEVAYMRSQKARGVAEC